MKKSDSTVLESYIREALLELRLNRQHPIWKKVSNFFSSLVGQGEITQEDAVSYNNIIKSFIKEVNSTREKKLSDEEVNKIWEFSKKALSKMRDSAKKSKDRQEEEKKIPEKFKQALNTQFSSLKYA